MPQRSTIQSWRSKGAGPPISILMRAFGESSSGLPVKRRRRGSSQVAQCIFSHTRSCKCRNADTQPMRTAQVGKLCKDEHQGLNPLSFRQQGTDLAPSFFIHVIVDRNHHRDVVGFHVLPLAFTNERVVEHLLGRIDP